MLTHGLLLQRVWGPERVGKGWLLGDVVKRVRRKLAQFLGAIDRVWADRVALGGNVIWQAVFSIEKAGDSARPFCESIGCGWR